MRRREFITLLGGAAAAWPLAARAQQAGRSRKVGVLHPGQAAAVNARITAIHEGLNDSSGQRSGAELVIRLADGELSRLSALAVDLVNDRVDAILAAGPPAIQAARTATADIPVIGIDLESDPVASGWVKSLARPGGNVTGVFLDFPDFGAKCLQLLIESTPALSGIGVLWDPTTGSLQLAAVETAARGMGIDLQIFEARRAADIADAFYAVDLAHIQGVLVPSSPCAEMCRPSRCFQISQERVGYSRTGQTFRDFIGRPELWCARCCRGLSRQSYRPKGRRDFS
jgi:putative ABC transport system substrate-binding protein